MTKKKEVLKVSDYVSKSQVILTTYIRDKHPDATSLDAIMENYSTPELCDALLAELSESEQDIIASPKNLVYDVMHTNNIKGYIELCLYHMFDNSLTA